METAMSVNQLLAQIRAHPGVVATRYDERKRAYVFPGTVTTTAIRLWLRA